MQPPCRLVALVVVCCAKSDNFFSSSSLRHPRLLCQHFLLKIRIHTCGIDYNPEIILCLNETRNTLQKYSNSIWVWCRFDNLKCYEILFVVFNFEESINCGICIGNQTIYCNMFLLGLIWQNPTSGNKRKLLWKSFVAKNNQKLILKTEF